MPAEQSSKRPNIVLILADDMGFSDLGCTGAEIRTPTLDRLAQGGALLSAMYNCARCCPTRAALLTGLYPHKAGIGHMVMDFGTKAYQGFLREDAATIAEVLRLGGYRTLMSGKWHVGGDLDARLCDQWRLGSEGHPTPRQRGFDRFFGTLDGGGSFWEPHYVMSDDSRTSIELGSFYLTDAISDRAVSMIEEEPEGEKPFFLYLAYTAPHWPLHAWPEDVARYDGMYRAGWDAIRTARHEEMNGKGVLQKPWDISPRDAEAPPFADMPMPDWEAERMAVYAAQVDRMDQGIGRVVSCLERLGQLDNTLILFLADNGGCAEFMAEDGWAQWYPDALSDGRPITKGNLPSLRPGGAQTFMSYDLPWANVSNAPFRLYKHWVHEGGISTPLIAHWPKGFQGPLTAHAPSHVVDILPTLLDASGLSYPSEREGHPLQALDGESLLPLLRGKAWQRDTPLYWEHEGNSAIRQGRWKLVRQHGKPWELYDMELDRTELNDLAAGDKRRVEELAFEYQGWAEKVGVLDWAALQRQLGSAWGFSDEE
ncbi:MAG: arylsulfatase [Pseudomonadota bacterium]